MCIYIYVYYMYNIEQHSTLGPHGSSFKLCVACLLKLHRGQYVDSKGVKRFVGCSKALKKSGLESQEKEPHLWQVTLHWCALPQGGPLYLYL